MTIGLLLMLAALLLVGHNRLVADDAGKQVQRVMAELVETMQSAPISSEPAEDPQAVIPAATANRVMATETIEGNRYIGVIEIPNLGISLPVAENYTDEQLHISPCRYNGTYYTDDMVICGHNYPEHFARIKYIAQDEIVYFVTVDGQRYTYAVLQSETVWPTEIERMLLWNDEEWDLTLFTCNNGGESRCAVRCVRIDDVD